MNEYKPEDLEAQAGEMDVLAHRAADKRNVDLSTRNRANKYLRAAIMLRAGAQAMRDLDLTIECVAAQNKLVGELIEMYGKEIHKAQARVKELEETIQVQLMLVHKQAEDDGLWFIARTAPEAYLQQELRKLHGAIEANAAALQVKP